MKTFTLKTISYIFWKKYTLKNFLYSKIELNLVCYPYWPKKKLFALYETFLTLSLKKTPHLSEKIFLHSRIMLTKHQTKNFYTPYTLRLTTFLNPSIKEITLIFSEDDFLPTEKVFYIRSHISFSPLEQLNPKKKRHTLLKKKRSFQVKLV